MALRIETFGLPGSGKSTLTRACLPLLRKGGMDVLVPRSLDRLDKNTKGPAPVLWRHSSFRQSYHIAEFQHHWGEVNQFFAGRYQGRFRNQALILGTGADVMKADRLSGRFDALWVDEGFLHYGMHAIGLGTTSEARALVGMMPAPDAVVLVDFDATSARESVLARSMAGGMSAKRASAYVAEHFGDLAAFQHRANLMDATCEALDAANIPIIRQPAMGPIEEMAQTANAAITALFEKQ